MELNHPAWGWNPYPTGATRYVAYTFYPKAVSRIRTCMIVVINGSISHETSVYQFRHDRIHILPQPAASVNGGRSCAIRQPSSTAARMPPSIRAWRDV